MSYLKETQRTNTTLIRHLKTSRFIYTKLGIPLEHYNNLNIFIEACGVNGLRVPKLFTFIFGLGYELFENCFRRANMKSIANMIHITRYMRMMFDDILKYGGREWFMDSKSYFTIRERCIEHNINESELFEYIDANKLLLLGESLLITKEKAESIIEHYLRRIV